MVYRLNNRELAIILWLLPTGYWLLSNARLRKPLLEAAKIFISPPLLRVNAIVVFAATASHFVFEASNPLPAVPIKNFVYWLIGTAILSAYRVASKGKNGLKDFAADTLRIAVIFEFLVNIATFSLPVELILMPVLHFVVLANALIDVKAELKQAKPLFSALQSFLGLALILWMVVYVVSSWPSIIALVSIRDLVYPVAMSILFSPVLALLHAYMVYEKLYVLIRMRVGDNKIARRLLVRAIMSFGLKAANASRWGRVCLSEGAEGELGWIHKIKEAKRRIRRERDKHHMPEKGYALYQAMHLLETHGLLIEEYNRLFDGRWSGSANKKLGESLLSSLFSYEIYGTADAVYQFDVSLDVMWPEYSEDTDLDEFAGLASHIVSSVLNTDELQELKFEFNESGRRTRILGDKRLTLEFEKNAFSNEGSFTLKLSVAYHGFFLIATESVDVSPTPESIT